ncbi:MAG: hypothetical protein R3C45_18945 [Phycisphaerales bacterium]
MHNFKTLQPPRRDRPGPSRSQKLQTNGLFFRLFDEYDQRPHALLPGLRRQPHHGAARRCRVLQASTRWPRSRIPHRESDPQRERARLLELAEHELDKAESKLGNGLGVRDAAIAAHAAGCCWLATARSGDQRRG